MTEHADPPAVAVVGLGDWGRHLLRVFTKKTSVPIVCHQGSQATAEWIQSNYPDVERVTDYEAVLADDSVDAVAIATPNETHAEFACRALEAGNHVFVEKPLATTVSEARDVATIAATTDAVAFVGYLFVHHPLVRRLRQIAAVDPVRRLRATWHKTGSFGPHLVDNIMSHHVAVGTALLADGGDSPGADPGSPAIHEASSSADPRLPAVSVRDREGPADDPDLLTAALAYNTGECVTTIDRCSPAEYHGMRVSTASGTVFAWADDHVSVRRDGGFHQVLERTREPLAAEVDAFLECVRTGRRPLTDAEFGVGVTRVCKAVRQAALAESADDPSG